MSWKKHPLAGLSKNITKPLYYRMFEDIGHSPGLKSSFIKKIYLRSFISFVLSFTAAFPYTIPMEPLSLVFTYTPEDVLAGYQLHFKKTLPMRMNFLVSFASVALGIFYLIFTETAKVGLLLVLLPLLLLGILGFFYYRLPLILYRHHDIYQGTLECFIDKDRVTLIHNGEVLDLDWRVYTKASYNEKTVILYYEKNRFTILPLRIISDEKEKDSLLSLLHSKRLV